MARASPVTSSAEANFQSLNSQQRYPPSAAESADDTTDFPGSDHAAKRGGCVDERRRAERKRSARLGSPSARSSPKDDELLQRGRTAVRKLHSYSSVFECHSDSWLIHGSCLSDRWVCREGADLG